MTTYDSPVVIIIIVVVVVVFVDLKSHNIMSQNSSCFPFCLSSYSLIDKLNILFLNIQLVWDGNLTCKGVFDTSYFRDRMTITSMTVD